jgi:hypothetical protein
MIIPSFFSFFLPLLLAHPFLVYISAMTVFAQLTASSLTFIFDNAQMLFYDTSIRRKRDELAPASVACISRKFYQC